MREASTPRRSGALAALSVRLNVPAEQVPMAALRKLLEENKAIVP